MDLEKKKSWNKLVNFRLHVLSYLNLRIIFKSLKCELFVMTQEFHGCAMYYESYMYCVFRSTTEIIFSA